MDENGLNASRHYEEAASSPKVVMNGKSEEDVLKEEKNEEFSETTFTNDDNSALISPENPAQPLSPPVSYVCMDLHR